jgi:hypothetical protein
MPKNTAKRRATRKKAARARKGTKATKDTKGTKDTKEREAFVDSLIAHGQAAKPRADGTLPPGATHEIVEGKDGEVKVVRRRFSLL